MKIYALGIDLGKTVFHLVGLDASGQVVVRKRCSRTQLLAFTANLQVQLLAWRPVVGLTLLIGDVCFHKLCQESERLLPAEVAPFERNDSRDTFLNDVQLGPARNLLQGYRHLDFPRQIRVVESVRVTNALVRHEFSIFATEGVAVPGSEICERHLVGTADLSVRVVNFPYKTIRRKPFCLRIRIKKRSINPLGRCTKHPVKPDRIFCHGCSPLNGS